MEIKFQEKAMNFCLSFYINEFKKYDNLAHLFAWKILQYNSLINFKGFTLVYAVN